MIGVFIISILSIVIMLEEVNAEEEFLTQMIIPTTINNTLLGEIEPIFFDSTSLDNVKKQFITIKQDKYNENMIFEENDKKVEVLTTKVPFILPVPFP